MAIDDANDPHGRQPILERGVPLADAKAVMVLLHGRGATGEGILSLAQALPRLGIAYRAPEAAGNSWYPESFLAPLARNEPFLSSALALADRAIDEVLAAGFPPERIVLLGFSQGACLALERAARSPRRYGGVVGLSGALIGNVERPGAAPPDDKDFAYTGSLSGTPVFLGSSDPDGHIPVPRVHRTAEVMRSLGGVVTERIYPGAPHSVNEDELGYVRDLLEKVTTAT